MNESYLILIEKILYLLEKNEETDASALAWETEWKQHEIITMLQEMAEKNWLSTYEIDMCCGAEYIVDHVTEEGKAAYTAAKQNQSLLS